MAAPRLLCFGLGYTAARLAAALRARGWEVCGTRRDLAAAEDLRREGVRAWPFQRGQPLPDEAWEGVVAVLDSVPPDAVGDPVLAEHRADLLARRGELRWVGLLSSTAVYGDRQGAEVDEDTPPAPTGPRGRARLAAERAWQELLPAGLPLHVFRLAGIYGPGRSALDRVRAGQARRLDKPGHAFARVHVDDIVLALLASLERPRPGALYNLCDELPTPAGDVIAYACELLGLPPPPLEPWDPRTVSPALAEFYAENKRVRSARLGPELGVRLRYPDYRAGLRAVLAEEATPPSPRPGARPGSP